MIDYTTRRRNLLTLRRRDALRDLEMLDAGQLWHPLDEDEYRSLLWATLEDIDAELSGDDFWREDDL